VIAAPARKAVMVDRLKSTRRNDRAAGGLGFGVDMVSPFLKWMEDQRRPVCAASMSASCCAGKVL
jgi:hypothetical protein